MYEFFTKGIVLVGFLCCVSLLTAAVTVIVGVLSSRNKTNTEMPQKDVAQATTIKEEIVYTMDDLESILEAHQGNRVLTQALAEADKPEKILRILGQYIHFSSTFGAAVSFLAGQIGFRQELFRDPGATTKTISDQSMNVAAYIFYAAIDEFGLGSIHRAMAQHTLALVGQYLGYEGASLEELVCPNPTTLETLEKIEGGYTAHEGLWEDSQENHQWLFQALGFHFASETLASEEFTAIKTCLTTRYPELIDYLKTNRAYAWIELHTVVEIEHANAARQGLDLALQYYVGDKQKAENWIMEGFVMFATMQTEFMESLIPASYP